MGKSHPMPGLESAQSAQSAQRPKEAAEGFGTLDWEFADDEAVSGETQVPPSRTRKTPPPAMLHEDSTRIVRGDALAEMARSTMPPPMEVEIREADARAAPIKRYETGSTRQATLDDDLMARARGDDGPPSSRQAPSGSGVSPKDQRVAAMREAYARGDADAALALAASIQEDAAAEEAASVDVEISALPDLEAVEDPFGGLVPVEDEVEEEAPPSLDPAVAALTLTQRQAIPRVVRSREEIAKLPIDHRGGFLLGFIDGNQTLEEILDICAMPTTDALGLIQQLQAMGVIELD